MFVISSPGPLRTDAECGFREVCEGASICPCNLECFAHEPTCSGSDGCCESDSDCLGEKCARRDVGIARRRCFSDGNCETGFACFGEYVCPGKYLCSG